MIIYKDILQKLKKAGYSTWELRKNALLTQSTLTYIRQGKPISLGSVDTICKLLNCQVGDILAYVPDEEPEASVRDKKAGDAT